MDFPISHARISRTSGAFRHQRGAKTRSNQAKKTVNAGIVLNEVTKTRTTELSYQQFVKFWTGIALTDQPTLALQLGPLNDPMPAERMTFGQSDNHALVPQRKSPVIPIRGSPHHNGNVNGIGRQIRKQADARSVCHININVGETMLIIHQGGAQIAGGKRCTDTNGQSTGFSPAMSLQSRKGGVDFGDDLSCGIEKLAAGCCWASAAIGAFEEDGTQLIFEIT